MAWKCVQTCKDISHRGAVIVVVVVIIIVVCNVSFLFYNIPECLLDQGTWVEAGGGRWSVMHIYICMYDILELNSFFLPIHAIGDVMPTGS